MTHDDTKRPSRLLGQSVTRRSDAAANGGSTPCGCDSREGHVEPYPEDEGHGERARWDAEYGLTGPTHVPDSGFDYGTFRGQDDAYCYCGHPNYMTCYAWLGVEVSS